MDSQCFNSLIRDFKISCYENEVCLRQNVDVFELSLMLIIRNDNEIYEHLLKHLSSYEPFIRDKFLQAAVRAKNSYVVVEDMSRLNSEFNEDQSILNSARTSGYITMRDFKSLMISKYSHNLKSFESNIRNCDLLWSAFSVTGSDKVFEKLFLHINGTPSLVRKIYSMYEEINPIKDDYHYYVGAINFNDKKEEINKIFSFVNQANIVEMISQSRYLNKMSVVFYIYALKRMNANIQEFSSVSEKVKKMFSIAK